MKSPWWITPNKCTPYMVVSHLGSSDCQTEWTDRFSAQTSWRHNHRRSSFVFLSFPGFNSYSPENPDERTLSEESCQIVDWKCGKSLPKFALLWINFDLFLILRFGSVIEHTIMALPLCYNVCTYIKSN